MNESLLELDNEYMYVRHGDISQSRASLLFVHGLGDSGLNFEDVFKDGRFSNFNVVVPDLIGYGRSSRAFSNDRYRYDCHITRLWQLIQHFDLSRIVLVGHSMGGDLTTLMCLSDPDGRIRRYVNIEGDLTQFDLAISGGAVKAQRAGRFLEWFQNDLKNRLVYEKLGECRSGRLYYASLCFCRPEALLDNAIEVVRRNTALPGKYQSEIGEAYCSIGIPKVFCHGTRFLSRETLEFIKERKLETKAFEGVGHCPMTDSSDEFYSFLHDFVRE